MSDFKPGEIVDITIKGAHVVDVRKLDECQLGVVFDCDSGLFPLTIPLGPPDVTVERVAPAEWPPRTGDLWRDANGMLYLALQPDDDSEEDGLPLSDISGDWLRARELAKRPGLTLVHREDTQDGSTS